MKGRKGEAVAVAVSIWPQILSPAVFSSRCLQRRRNRANPYHSSFSSSLSLQQLSAQKHFAPEIFTFGNFQWISLQQKHLTSMEAVWVFYVFNTFTEVFHVYSEGLSSGIGEWNYYLHSIILTPLSNMQYKATNFFLLEHTFFFPLDTKHLWNWSSF